MSFFKGRFILFYTITGEFDKMRILLSDCVRNTSLIYVLFSDYRSLRFCAFTSVDALFIFWRMWHEDDFVVIAYAHMLRRVRRLRI